MYIKAFSNKSISQIFANLVNMPEWDADEKQIMDDQGKASVNVRHTPGTDKVFSLSVTTESDFSYTIRAWGGRSQIEYRGALEGFLRQNLLPDLGEVTIQEARATFTSSSLVESISMEAFTHVRKVLHGDVERAISPLRLGDIKWGEEELLRRVGLELRYHGGFCHGAACRSHLLGAWATPERHKQLEGCFAAIQTPTDTGLEEVRKQLLNIEGLVA